MFCYSHFGTLETSPPVFTPPPVSKNFGWRLPSLSHQYEYLEASSHRMQWGDSAFWGWIPPTPPPPFVVSITICLYFRAVNLKGGVVCQDREGNGSRLKPCSSNLFLSHFVVHACTIDPRRFIEQCVGLQFRHMTMLRSRPFDLADRRLFAQTFSCHAYSAVCSTTNPKKIHWTVCRYAIWLSRPTLVCTNLFLSCLIVQFVARRILRRFTEQYADM